MVAWCNPLLSICGCIACIHSSFLAVNYGTYTNDLSFGLLGMSFGYSKTCDFGFFTVWSEGFLYNVAPLKLKNSPIMYFVIHNSVVSANILKIVVPFWSLFVYVDYYQNNQFYYYRVKNRIFKILLLWHNNFQYFR